MHDHFTLYLLFTLLNFHLLISICLIFCLVLFQLDTNFNLFTPIMHSENSNHSVVFFDRQLLL